MPAELRWSSPIRSREGQGWLRGTLRETMFGDVGVWTRSQAKRAAIQSAVGGSAGDVGCDTVTAQEGMQRQANSVHGTRRRVSTGMQVVRHGALGRSNREIGKSMRVDVDTVKERGQLIFVFSKRELSGRTQAAVGMLKNNLV